MLTDTNIKDETNRINFTAIAAKLGPGFASRSAQHDADASFVAENFEEMREHKLFSAAVPAELGGGGAELAEMWDVLRELGRYDGSTALAFSMHSHLLETLKWRYRHNLTPSSEPPLRRLRRKNWS